MTGAAMAVAAAQAIGEPIPGDDYVEAAGGNCTPLSALLSRVGGMSNAVMLTSDDFDGHVRLFELGCLRACRISCRKPMKVDGREVLETDLSQGGHVHVLVQLSGTMTVTRLGRTRMVLEPDDWCVICPVGRFWAEASVPVEFMLLVIPGEELRSIGDTVAKLSERRIRAQTGPAHLFRRFLLDVIVQTPTLGAASRISFSDAVIQVLKAAMLDLAHARRMPIAHEHLYQRACDIVESNLGNEHLSVEFVAQRIHCSKRYLHAVFARHNAQYTLNGYINARRLARCRSELLMQQSSGRSIAEIAHRWGFQDPSYFARLFRREYGLPPRAFIAKTDAWKVG